MYVTPDPTRLCQGDIITDVTVSFATIDGELDQTPHEFMVVLAQDCDLQQDYDARLAVTNGSTSNDKFIENVLVCPAFVSDKLKAGTHLNNLSLQMQYQNTGLWKPITNNNNPRYHHLNASLEVGLPDLAIDFKRYHAIQRDFMYSLLDKRVIRLDELHSTALTHRFSYYLSRVALPELPTTE